jgi:hypothetical protein
MELVGKNDSVKTIEIDRCDDSGFNDHIGDDNLSKMAKKTSENGNKIESSINNMCVTNKNINSVQVNNGLQIEHLKSDKTVDRTTRLKDNKSQKHKDLGKTNSGFKNDIFTNTSDKGENTIKDNGYDIKPISVLSSPLGDKNMSTNDCPSNETIAKMSTNNELVITCEQNNYFKGDILINNTSLVTL